jgi:DNA polymerase III subunit delta'
MSFREVIGHRRLLSLLSHAITRDTLMPSLIFSGPEGVGKRLTAVAVAQALNCPNPVDSDSCGDCPACRRIVRGSYPDVQTIEPGESGSIKIEQVRAAIDQAVFRPFEGRRRVTMIDHADAMADAAQNALLKSLEEPPSASVFILITSRPDTLLPTVRSRCSQLRFGRLQVADVAAVLEKNHNYTRADAQAAAAASDGSVQHALNLEAEAYAEARDDAENLLRVAGRDPRTRLDHARGLLKGEGSPAAEREHLAVRLHALASVLRDVGLLASGADARLLANLDRRAALDAVARNLGRDSVDASFDAVTTAYDALERNVGPKVIADWLAVNVH